MKRSEATPGMLKQLEDPENLYTFEEDEIEMNIVWQFILHEKKWNIQNGVNDEQREEIEENQEMVLRIIEERKKRGLLSDKKNEIIKFIRTTTGEEKKKMYQEYFGTGQNKKNQSEE